MMAKQMKSAQQVADKWARNLSAAGPSIKAGVEAVTENPAQKAIAAKQRWIDALNRAATNGAYERGLSKVTTDSWRQAMLEKGLPRIATGAEKAKARFADFYQKFGQYQQGLQSKLQGMPRGDLAQNIQRMIAAVEYQAAYKDRA